MADTLRYNFIKEFIEKSNRDIKIIDKYRPDSQAPVTEKFYAKHDAFPQNFTYLNEHFDEILQRRTARPRDLYPEPVLESHVYGWYNDLAMKYDEFDHMLMHHGRINSEMTRHGIRILLEKLRK